MTTPTIEQIHRHASIRSYKPDPVPGEMVEEIIAASQRTSTSSNLQVWTVVAVTGEESRARLLTLCGNQKHIRQAPLFLAWCADLSRLDRLGQMLGYGQHLDYAESFITALMDASIAMQTAALAAESLGLGICYIGGLRNNPRDVIELLQLPPFVFPVCGMTVGWPAEQPLKKPRLPLEVVLHWEQYDLEGLDDRLHAYDQQMIDAGIYKRRRVPVPGREGETREFGWMERSARKFAKPFRVSLRGELEDQGFKLR